MSLKTSGRTKPKRRAAGEGWVSYNRVLVGNMASKKIIGRNPNFDTDETKLLIQLWGDPKVQRTLITTHKKHSVICQLAAQMQEYGYFRSPEEITTRIKNLKCFYNRLKKEMDPDQSPDAEPSWRHFAEMDAIMTRPIFSVRPNEVPQPSLKYQLEQKRQEREERRQQILEEGGSISESEDNIDDDIDTVSKTSIQDIDDGIIPDVEVDMDINDETFAAITAGEAPAVNKVGDIRIINGEVESDGDEDDEEKPLQIKEETDSNNMPDDENQEFIKTAKDTKKITNGGNVETTKATTKTDDTASASTEKEDAALIIPKEEPIDVDAEYEVNLDAIKTNVGELMPTLAEMLKMTNSNGSGTIIQTNTTATTSSIAAAPSNGTQTAKTSVSNVSPQGTTGKISLVPASFLLQPKTVAGSGSSTTPGQQLQLLPNAINGAQAQMQPRILLSSHGSTGSGSSGSQATGIVTTGPGGMKLLLVNAEQAAASGCLQQQLQQQVVGAQQQQQQYKQILQSQQQQDQHQQEQQKRKLKRLSDEKRKERKKTKNQQYQRVISPKDAPLRDATDVTTTTRQLIYQLHDMLEQNTDIQRQRLKIEIERLEAQRAASDLENKRLALDRERFEFERTAFDRLLGVFPTLLQKQQQQTAQVLHPEHVSAASAKMLFNPSKLLFTTAGGTATFAANVPAVSGATAVFAPSSSFTTATLTAAVAPQPIELCTKVNELQMITPKVENEQ